MLSGCYTSKPAGLASNPDYNKRVNVSGAHTVKRKNALGVTVSIGLVGAGAAGGYYTPLVQKQTATGQEPVRVANAVIGAAAGAGISYLIDVIAGKNKSNYDNIDVNKWIKKANPQYKLLAGSGNNFTIIHPSAESNYTVKNIQDVRNFKTVFSRSVYSENVVQQALKLNRNDMPELLTLYPDTKYANDIKVKYITESPSFSDALAAARKYPIDNADELCMNLIQNTSNAVDFLQAYLATSFKKEAVINAFRKPVAGKSDMDKLEKSYGNLIFLTDSDLKIKSDDLKQNYYLAMYKLADPTSETQFNNFISIYKWLSYNNRNSDIIGLYWDLVNPAISTGTEVLRKVSSMKNNPLYNDYHITQSDLINAVHQKLNEEVKKVNVIKVDYFGAENKDFENWKQQTGFSARAVSFKGAINYIVYGEIQNNSKFDLPIELKAKGTLQMKRTTRAANWLDPQQQGFSLLGGFASLMAATQPNEIKDIERKEASNFIPLLPTHERAVYAVMIEFGEHEQGGAVMLGIVRQEVEAMLANVQVTPLYCSKDISVAQLQKQNYWQQFTKSKKLPSTARLMDYSASYYGALTGQYLTDEGIDMSYTQGLYDVANEYGSKALNYVVEAMNTPDYGSSSDSYSSGNSSKRDDSSSNNSNNSNIDPEKVTNPGFSFRTKWDNTPKKPEEWLKDDDGRDSYKIIRFSAIYATYTKTQKVEFT
ncbi:hypothetical protein FACS189434_01680 [Bacteroidia bacterium]|nr:hypothetical protein FACS189434_01680 [Bacteroidia bacterium]